MAGFFPDESIMSIEPEEEHLNLRMYFDEVVNIHVDEIDTILLPATCGHFPVAM